MFKGQRLYPSGGGWDSGGGVGDDQGRRNGEGSPLGVRSVRVQRKRPRTQDGGLTDHDGSRPQMEMDSSSTSRECSLPVTSGPTSPTLRYLVW